MTQRLIDVDGVPTLFSPVLAHTLEPGDLFTLTLGPALRFREVPYRRVLAVTGRTATHLGIVRNHPHLTAGIGMSLRLNSTVYRAIGARGGRGGSR